MISPEGGLSVLQDLKDSKARASEMTFPQMEATKALFADPDIGLWWFAREIFGFRDLTWEFHGPICQLLGHWGESHLADGRVITHTPKAGYEEENIKASYRRLMLRIPRETFKSSLGTRACALRVLSMNSNETIGIFNETENLPKQWIDAIRQVAETSILFQTLYRDIIPKGIGYWDREKGVTTSRKLKWGGTGILFERGTQGVSELSIEPHGITGTAVGKHFTRMIWDDIIGLKASLSPAVMETAIDWVDNSRPLERPAEGGCVLVNHTTWAYADVYKHMEQKWPGEWQIFHRSLLENPETGEPDEINGISTFPTKISTAKAKAMQERDPYVFAAQYQCIPKAGRTQSFDPDWDGRFHIIYEGQEPVIHIDRTGGCQSFDGTNFELDMADPPDFAPQRVPLSWCTKSVILDPAPSKGAEVRQNRHARNGFVVCAVDPWGRRYNLDSRVSRDTPEMILDQMIGLSREWQAWIWSIEEVVFSAVYEPLWSAIISLKPEYRDVRPEWRPVKPAGRDKEGRIRNNLIGIHELGLVYYNKGDPKLNLPGCPSGYLLKEKNEFPHGQTVDTLDAFAYIDESVQKPLTLDRRHRNSFLAKHSGLERGITGYGGGTYEST